MHDELRQAVRARQGVIADKYANITGAVREHQEKSGLARRSPAEVAVISADLLRMLGAAIRCAASAGSLSLRNREDRVSAGLEAILYGELGTVLEWDDGEG
ncbi:MULTISPECIES: hypothetical protein [unclassified Chelatococcus]|uniref:hypothetical protein n=1 Tax=unclassified Chelatococcus TaxID=2638111 RepID=UPI0002E08D00|nr:MULTISPECIES: hypothetical protein [unclassified Chelatococcus]ALA18029.1 hypothetical protein AL346_12225 [Chelatococcus sp. CO-6]